MAWAFRRHRSLFVLFGGLNLLVAASTMTTGWHYFADVLAGVAVGVLSIAVVHWVSPWLHPRRRDGDGAQRPASTPGWPH